MTTQHTPWYLDVGGEEVWICRHSVDAVGSKSNREILAKISFHVVDGCQLNYIEVMKNAAFIVRACNEYSSDKALIERLLKEYQKRVHDNELDTHLVNCAYAAVDKAK